MFERYLGGIWEVLASFWKVFERYFSRYLGGFGRFWEVLEGGLGQV